METKTLKVIIVKHINCFFHYSSLRTAELKKIASDHSLRVLSIPKISEIRWSQFTFTLLRNVLVSWKALVFYFRKNETNAQCAGYLDYLTKLDNVKLIAFLTDVLFVFKRFHKKLQSDQFTLIEMKKFVKKTLRWHQIYHYRSYSCNLMTLQITLIL